MSEFIPHKGYYRNLIVYQISEIIYDITYVFTQRFLQRGDRTIDQMVQAARSGKQNIAEGSSAGTTSKETEIKLTNVAKASLQELLLDYEDYLRVRDLEIWDKESEKALITRKICATNRESVANIAIILIHQADTLLKKLINRQKQDFLQQGGIREQMSQARIAHRTQKNKIPPSK